MDDQKNATEDSSCDRRKAEAMIGILIKDRDQRSIFLRRNESIAGFNAE